MFTVRKRMGLVVGLSTAALILSGCASSGGSTASGTPAAAADVSGATAFAKPYLAAPTALQVTTPLSGAAPKGKKIIALTNSPLTEMEAAAMEAATEKLGWTFKDIKIGSGAEDAQNAFEQAVTEKPDGIWYTGFSTATVQKQLTEAQAAGIVLVAQSLGEDTPPEVAAQIRPNSTEVFSGKVEGAQIVSQSNGKAHTLYVSLPRYPVTAQTAIGMQQAFDEFCPDCKLDQLQAQAADLGTVLPGQVVSALQRDPSINWVVFNFGDMSQGVQAAIDSAGLTDQVTLAGGAPNDDNLASLKKGLNGFYLDNLGPQMGWQVMDVFARAFVGDDVSVDEGNIPTQVLTKDNIGSASINAQGYWYAPADYEAQYLKLWGVK